MPPRIAGLISASTTTVYRKERFIGEFLCNNKRRPATANQNDIDRL